MADYAKLTNYLEGNKNAGPTTSESISSGLSGITSSMSGLFGRSQSTNSVNDADQQTDSWFREADKDDWCPKMVRLLFLSSLSTPLLNFIFLNRVGHKRYLASVHSLALVYFS